MKKILILIPSSLIITFLFILILILSTNKNVDLTYYSLKRNYSFIYDDNSNNEFKIDIYTTQKNNLIDKINENIYKIILDTNSYTIDINDIKNEKINNYYKMTYYITIPYIIDELESHIFNFKISNDKSSITFDLGSLSIINSKKLENDTINIKEVTQEISNIKYICGIDIKNYKHDSICELKSGIEIFGVTKYIKESYISYNDFDIYKIYPNYNISLIPNSYKYNLTSNNFFIPITYKKILPSNIEYIKIKEDSNIYYYRFEYIDENKDEIYIKNNYLEKGIYNA